MKNELDSDKKAMLERIVVGVGVWVGVRCVGRSEVCG